MTAFRTCHTCAKPAATCATREALQTAITGLGITSVKHRCADYRPAFLPGDPVKVLTLAWYHNDEDPPLRRWFPGHFIQLSGTRALVVVPRKAIALDDGETEFEPHGNGYLKVPLSRIAHRDGKHVDVEACRWCAAIPGVGDPCGRDPHYTPRGHCLAEARTSDQSAQRKLSDAALPLNIRLDEPILSSEGEEA